MYAVEPTKTMTPLVGDASATQYPVYEFKNWKVEGADGEDFMQPLS